ncbi:sodium:solute symporter family protein [Bacillus sp. FJAT-29790]|uniref:sodium:solute symporter family protein n=1 Tax=Bacillus sp. FJAT-29790 TaxID=1895002 RepID=UPI001C23F292|nr:sodium:solute symporter family protein [Bacillus sp. FJAT-29790]MBU8878408.1 sodium:solute symporter family protein [Bacillus sp. FJAT-29790]
MQISAIDLFLIIIYFLIVLWIGYYTMKKISSFDDYSVAGRSMPMALVYATIGATLVGGGATIGRVSFVYETGIVVFLALLGVVISQVLSGFFLAPRIRTMKNIYTIGDIMDFYFGRSGQLISSIIAFLFMASLFGVQVLAMGRILEPITGLPFVPLCIIGTLIIIAYTWAGGLLAVIYTDAVQFILLIASIATASLLGVHQMGGMTEIIEKVGAINPDNLVIFGGPWTFSVFISAFLAFLLGDTLAPYYIQRYASSKTASVSKWSTVSFGVTYIFLTIVIMVIGLIGIIIFPDMKGDLVFVNFVKSYLPVGMVGIVFGGLLAVVMSTGSSLLNTAAVIYTRDIHSKLINKSATDKSLLNTTKYATLIVGIVGIVISLLIPNVMNLMLYTYTLWAPSILPPLVIALIWGGPSERKVSPYAGPPAIIAGMLMTIIWLNFLGEPFGIPGIVMGIVTNLVVFGITHIMTANKIPASSSENIDV